MGWIIIQLMNGNGKDGAIPAEKSGRAISMMDIRVYDHGFLYGTISLEPPHGNGHVRARAVLGTARGRRWLCGRHVGTFISAASTVMCSTPFGVYAVVTPPTWARCVMVDRAQRRLASMRSSRSAFEFC